MADFPLSTKEDARKYGLESEDKGIRSDMEGGYVLSRPRHTRNPRRTFITGFTGLMEADFNTFYAFWVAKGTYLAFTYEVKYNNETVNVRFQAPPRFEYVGVGGTDIWNINDIKLEEV